MTSAFLHRLEILVGISLTLSFFKFGRTVLFPFQIFTTWVHESCHALMAAILGGSSIRITISADGSGLTHYKIPPSRFRQGMVASSGYVGASLVGCLIFLSSAQAERFTNSLSVHALFILITTSLGLTLLFWIRNAFGWISILLFALALLAMRYSKYDTYLQDVLIFLGVQTALNALFDIRVLFHLGSVRTGATSDAHTLQKLFYLPYWVWAFLWLGMSVGLMGWTSRWLKI